MLTTTGPQWSPKVPSWEESAASEMPATALRATKEGDMSTEQNIKQWTTHPAWNQHYPCLQPSLTLQEEGPAPSVSIFQNALYCKCRFENK